MALVKIQIMPAILSVIVCCLISAVSCFFSSEPNRLLVAGISCFVLSIYAMGFSSVKPVNAGTCNLLTGLSVFFFLGSLVLNFFAEYLSFVPGVYLFSQMAFLVLYLLLSYIIIRK